MAGRTAVLAARGTLAALALTFIAGCSTDSAPTRPTARLTALPPVSATARAEMDRATARADAVRKVVHAAAADGRKNADKWFGPESERSRDRFCDGLTKLVKTYAKTAEQERGQPYTDSERARLTTAALQGAGCATPGTMSLFAARVLAAPQAITDDVIDPDAFLAQNFTQAYWGALESYRSYASLYGPTNHSLFCGGLTDFEAQVFDGSATRADNELAYYTQLEASSGGSGDDGGGKILYSLFLQSGGSMRDAIISGCIGGVTGFGSEIIGGARAGAFLCGFWCAVGGAVAVAAEGCAWGGLGGYLAYKARAKK